MTTSPTQFTLVGAYQATNLSLSSDGLTVTSSGSPGQLYGNNPQSAGSFYFEITFTNLSNWIMPGVGSLAQMQAIHDSLSDDGGAAAAAYLSVNGNCYLNGGGSGKNLGAASTGDVLSVAVALPNLIWFRLNSGPWNNDGTADPASGVGGISLAALAAPFVPVMDNHAGSVAHANFGQAAFVYAPPALFGDWPGIESIVLNTIAPGTIGAPLAISGTTFNGVASALDYSVDDQATWTPLAGYVAGSIWSGTGPTYSGAAFGKIYVRDHNNPSVVGSAPFSVPQAVTGTQISVGSWTLTSGVAGATPNYGSSPTSVNLGFFNEGDPGDTYYHTSSAANSTPGADTDDFLIEFNYAVTVGALFKFDVGAGSANANDAGYGIDANSTHLDDGTAVGPGIGYFYTATGGRYQINTPQTGHIEISITWDVTTNSITSKLVINGEVIVTDVAAGQTVAPFVGVDATPTFLFYTYNYLRNGAPNPNLTITGLGAYDITPPVEVLTITSANGYGGPVQLAGTNAGTIATAMDYSLDAGAWTLLPALSSGASWTGQGPMVAAGQHTIQVRDDARPVDVSNIVTFTVGQGIFVWDGVRIHP